MRGPAPVWGVGVKAPHQFLFSKWLNSWTIFFQISKVKDLEVKFYMKDAECGETNEKSILPFLVFEIQFFFYSKLVSFSINFEYKIGHNSRNNNRKKPKIDFSFVLGHCAIFRTLRKKSNFLV